MNYKWDLEKLMAMASQCKTRMEFHKRFPGPYSTCWKRKILDIVCAHMERQGSKQYRWIYVIEFSNKSVYVGLTGNINERKSSHLRKSSNKFVRENINNNLDYKWIKKTDLLSKEMAAQSEELIKKEYSDSGWKILNIQKTGGLGGADLKWNRENLLALAKEFRYKFELQKKHPGAYLKIHRLRITKEAFSHMDKRAKLSIKWDFESIKKEALKYNTRKEFESGSTGAYQRAGRTKVLDLVCGHMKNQIGLKNSIKVYQFDLNMKLIKVWGSFSDARRAGFSGVHASIKRNSMCKGFYWRYSL
jgi:predicted GIY-YIG superfamily endonuclease